MIFNKVSIFESTEAIAMAAGALVELSIQELAPQEYLTLAISGGNTPGKIFEYWATHYVNTIPWDRIRLFWVDERCVPPTDPQSNYKMTCDTLLRHVPIPSDQVFPIFGDRTPADEARRYHTILTGNVPIRNGLPQFHLIFLGIGEDGHTASIFPGQTELFRSQDLCAVSAHPDTGLQRITLTGPVLNNAQRVAFLVTGSNKAPILHHLLGTKPDPSLPASRIQPTSDNLLWLLDKDAAGKSV